MKTKISLAAIFCAGMVYAADMIVSASDLPQNAQNFIQTHFKDTNIALVKKDIDSYDVTLQDGTEIDFIINGEWKEIDNKYKGLPESILDKDILAKIKTYQNQAQIIEISKEINGYEIKFNNYTKIYTDKNGNILGHKKKH